MKNIMMKKKLGYLQKKKNQLHTSFLFNAKKLGSEVWWTFKRKSLWWETQTSQAVVYV